MRLVARFTIPGEPVAQERPRLTGCGRRCIVYDQPKSRHYKQAVAACAKAAMRGREPSVGAVLVSVVSYRRSLRRFTAAQRMNPEGVRPSTRPDVDNYAKAVLDGMNGICYRDDGQVFFLGCRKAYSDDPRTEVEVWEE